MHRGISRRAEQAFQDRPVRVRGKVVDSSGEPLPDLQVVLSHINRVAPGAHYYQPITTILPSESWPCLSDEQGSLVLVEGGGGLMNPLAATGSAGEFEMGDWRSYVKAGEYYTAFVRNGDGCRRLLRSEGSPEFRIDVDAEVVDLGVLTVAN